MCNWTSKICSILRMQSGYPCLSLHGGKDQSDRESTISDFKSNVCNVLVATSVAARGLDVKDLVRRGFIMQDIGRVVPKQHVSYLTTLPGCADEWFASVSLVTRMLC
jgi:superfamily II DNA/RNA helicase